MLAKKGAEGRAVKRIKIFQPATLVVGGDRRRVHLLDVSREGALVHAQAPVGKWAEVRVECMGIVRPAVVRWSEGKRFGLLFDDPLMADQVQMLSGSKAAA